MNNARQRANLLSNFLGSKKHCSMNTRSESVSWNMYNYRSAARNFEIWRTKPRKNRVLFREEHCTRVIFLFAKECVAPYLLRDFDCGRSFYGRLRRDNTDFSRYVIFPLRRLRNPDEFSGEFPHTSFCKIIRAAPSRIGLMQKGANWTVGRFRLIPVNRHVVDNCFHRRVS